MIDDDSEPSISDTTPGAQVIELTDSLDLSRLHINNEARAVLAQILLDLETECNIPCADIAILSPDKSEVSLMWKHRSKGKVSFFSIILNLTDYSTQYTFNNSTTHHEVTQKSLIKTLEAITVLRNWKIEAKESNQPYHLN